MAQDNESKRQEEEKKFKIEDLPESTRKTIWWVSVIILAAVLTLIWLKSTVGILSQPRGEKNDNELDSITNNLKGLGETTKQDFGAMQKEINALLGENATSTVSPSEIEVLKERLQQKQTADWQIYQDAARHFQIKFPADFIVATATRQGDTSFIAGFRPRNDLARIVMIKKYPAVTEFSSLPNLKKYFSRDNEYWAIFDTVGSTTTDLMITTFKFLK